MEQEALLRRAREDAKRIVQRLRSSLAYAPTPTLADEVVSASSLSTRSLAGRIVRQAEIQGLAGSDADRAEVQALEITELRQQVARLERLLHDATLQLQAQAQAKPEPETQTKSQRQLQAQPPALPQAHPEPQALPQQKPQPRKLLPSVVKEMSRMEKGVWGEKLSFGSSLRFGKGRGSRKLQERFMFVQKGRLYWNESGDNSETSDSSSVLLTSVSRVEFGSIYVAQLFETADTWKCVSIFTKDRSFDFKLYGDEDTAALVVLLSRLCPQVSEGIPKTRAQFVFRRALCKIENAARKQNISKTRLLIEAFKRAAAVAT